MEVNMSSPQDKVANAGVERAFVFIINTTTTTTTKRFSRSRLSPIISCVAVATSPRMTTGGAASDPELKRHSWDCPSLITQDRDDYSADKIQLWKRGDASEKIRTGTCPHLSAFASESARPLFLPLFSHAAKKL